MLRIISKQNNTGAAWADNRAFQSTAMKTCIAEILLWR